MKAIWKDKVLAESDNTIVIEGNHYFPAESIKQEYFSDSDQTSVCPWKGEANYYDIEVDNETNEAAAWYYAEPKDMALDRVGESFANYVAFWKGVEVHE